MGGRLAGRRILVTRAPEQGAELGELLAGEGAEPIYLPLLRIEPPADPAALTAALADLSAYDWVVFTSRNGVEQVAAQVDLRTAKQIAVVGDGTADAVRETGAQVDLVPDHQHAEGLLSSLRRQGVAGTRMLLPQAHNARALLADGLRYAGAEVTAVEAYRGLATDPQISAAMLAGIDAVTFASSATVERFIDALGWELVARCALRGCRWIAIGSRTAVSLRQLGLVPVMAERPSPAGITAACIAALAA